MSTGSREEGHVLLTWTEEVKLLQKVCIGARSKAQAVGGRGKRRQ